MKNYIKINSKCFKYLNISLVTITKQIFDTRRVLHSSNTTSTLVVSNQTLGLQISKTVFATRRNTKVAIRGLLLINTYKTRRNANSGGHSSHASENTSFIGKRLGRPSLLTTDNIHSNHFVFYIYAKYKKYTKYTF